MRTRYEGNYTDAKEDNVASINDIASIHLRLNIL